MTTTSTTVAFTGAALPATDTIAVAYSDGTTAQDATVSGLTNPGSTWGANVDFTKLAPGQKTVEAVVTAVTLADGTVDTTVAPADETFTFATAPVVAATPAVTSTPDYDSTDDVTADGQGVTLDVTGFAANEPLTIAATSAKGATVALTTDPATATTDATGAYTGTAFFPEDVTGGDYAITITGQTSKETVATEIALIGDPTITAPTDGQKIVGTTATFAGTGTPGSNIVLFYGPAADFADFDQAALQQRESALRKAAAAGRSVPDASSPSDPASPTDPIVVAANGTWSVTVAVKPGAYKVVAFGALLDSSGNQVENSRGDFPTTIAAQDPAFTVVAPAAVITPAAAPGTGTGTLAFTGSQDAVPATIGGGILLLAGLGLVVVARRRRSAADQG